MHLDQTLGRAIESHGVWVYAVLFAIIFAETGLVIMPFLPGDSLLFAAGVFTGSGAESGRLNLWVLLGVLVVAAVFGDALNYHVGRWVGPRVFRRGGLDSASVGGGAESGRLSRLLDRVLDRRHLDRAGVFYKRYGGKAVVLGRFVPVVRTFVPFVAGAGSMAYGRFLAFNVVGAVLWVGVCVLAGHFFGHIEVVRKNFSLVALGIVCVSLLPVVVEVVLSRRAAAGAVGGVM